MKAIAARTTPDVAWAGLYSMQGPEGKESALNYMWNGILALSPTDRQLLEGYLKGMLCDRTNGSAPKLTYNGLHIGPVIADLAVKLSHEQGSVPGVLYDALKVLPFCDERTRIVLGYTLLLKPDKKEVRLKRLSDIASQPDAEDAFRIMRRVYGVPVIYAGILQDYDEEVSPLLGNAGPQHEQSKAEILDAYPDDPEED